LRVIFEVNLVSVEQLTFREFLQRIPDLTYLATFQVKPMGATAALDLEPSLVFPIIGRRQHLGTFFRRAVAPGSGIRHRRPLTSFF
jgi:hypothetical protein